MEDKQKELSDLDKAFFEHINKIEALWPARLALRMSDDEWYFGLKVVTGETLVVGAIDDISKDASGAIWIDTRLHPQGSIDPTTNHPKIIEAEHSRAAISINLAHIVYVVELCDG